MQPIIKLPTKQKGIALLMLLVIIVLTVTSYYMSGLSLTEIRVNQELKTLKVLNKAKQALLAYAMNYPDTLAGMGNTEQGPGNFPCPAKEIDGVPDTLDLNPTCNSLGVGVLAYYPWKVIETGDIRDGSGELLWYAVSNNYANFAGRDINTSTPGQIMMRNKDGTVPVGAADPLNAIVAVIIAPGEALVRGDGIVQARGTPAELTDSKNYLDIAYDGMAGLEEDNADFTNASATDGFIPGPIVDAANNVIVNDQFVTITYEEIMELMHARAAVEIGNTINAYFAACNFYPEAADPTPDPVINGVFEPTSAGPYNSAALRQGLLPVDVALPKDWDDVAECTKGIKFPDWVKAEEWHLHTYYEFAATIPCQFGTDCLTANNSGAPTNNKDALIVFSGRELVAQDRDTIPVDMSDYFELENNNGDLVFDSAESEDYVHVIAP